MDVASRLAAAGETLPPIPAAAGVYIPAVASGHLVFTAGQLPFVDGVLPLTGRVGSGVSLEEARSCARGAALNALAAAASAIGSLDRVVRVVKVTGFVASDPSFTAQPAVVDGASELLGTIFAESGRHARSAVGVAVLPLDAPVEVELVLEFA